MAPAVPRAAAVPGRSLRPSGAGNRMRDYPIPEPELQPADATGADHQSGGTEALAQAVPESPGDPRDGTGRALSGTRDLCLDRQLAGSGPEALLASDRGAFRASGPERRTRGTESGTATR